MWLWAVIGLVALVLVVAVIARLTKK